MLSGTRSQEAQRGLFGREAQLAGITRSRWAVVTSCARVAQVVEIDGFGAQPRHGLCAVVSGAELKRRPVGHGEANVVYLHGVDEQRWRRFSCNMLLHDELIFERCVHTL